MDKEELLKLRAHLRRSFGAPTLSVVPSSAGRDAADVSLGERRIGSIAVDDEDGDRSFSFEMKNSCRTSCNSGLFAPLVRK